MILPLRRRNLEALPGDPLGQRLCQIFTYRWQAIAKVNDPEFSWETITKYPLTPRKLWNLWQDAAQIVGVRFGRKTQYAMIDVDIGSPYHPKQDEQALSTLRAALETIGITRTFLTQSSFSGGYHLWLPLPEAVRTFWLAAALKQCLEAQHFVIKQGWLEIFPNCKSYALPGEFTEYQGHRLPLQPATGAQIVDQELNLIPGGLERFFELWDHCAAGQSMDELAQAIHQAETNKKGRYRRHDRSIVESWREDHESEIREGWTDHGQTNHLLKTIACHGVVFKSLKGEALVNYVQQTAVQCPGYTQWCRHQHEMRMRCTVWARAAEGYYWALGTEGNRQGNFHHEQSSSSSTNRVNQKRAEEAQLRIKTAYERLLSEGRLPQGKTARENLIVQEAHCSKQTTRKYLHLWYPEQNSTTQAVCTSISEPVSGQLSPISGAQIKPLEPLLIREVHTSPYMKGIGPTSEAGSDFSQPSLPWGGAGGLSTASNDITDDSVTISQINSKPQNGSSHVLSTSPPTASSISRRHESHSKPKSSRSKLALPDYQPKFYGMEDAKLEFGKLVRQLDWSLEQVKHFLDQTLGKTIQALAEDDWILLLYQMRNLTSSG